MLVKQWQKHSVAKAEQGAGSSTRAHPIRSRTRLTLGGGHGDIAPEPDQIVEFQLFGQNLIQLLITEPTIRHDQDFNIRRAGPDAEPLFPAADRHVIAVTATDANNKLFPG